MQRALVLLLNKGFLQIALALLVLAPLLFELATAEAQTSLQQIGIPGEQLSVNLSPNIPGPNERVTARAESFSTDLDRATLAWYVSGKLVEQGLGKTEITFTTGEIGKATTVSVSASLPGGQQLQQSLTIVPADVDLVVQPFSYTHPFYKGRKLLPPNAPVTLVAIPHFKTTGGQRISERNLIYTWQEDTKTLGNFSGTGKNTLILTGPQIYRTKTITLTVRSLDGALHAVRSISLEPSGNVVHLYETHPLLGVQFDSAITTKHIEGREISLLAEPYFFSSTNRLSSELQYIWTLNGSFVQNPGDDLGVMTLRPSGTGQANLAIQIREVNAYLEKASRAVELSFDTGE